MRTTHVRWFICALLFAIVALNYVDRQVLSVLKPTLQKDYSWSETGYGSVVFWFQAAYGIGYLAFGRIVDRIGAKAGGAIAVAIWTVSHMAHALVTSTRGFAWVRIPMGLGGGSGMVSPTRAGPSHRHLQRRLQYRRGGRALYRSHHHHRLGLADGVHRHGTFHGGVGGGPADLVSP